jgi:hypothetical protein
VEAADPGRSSPLAERGHQRRAHAVVLPFVDHLDRHLRGVELVQTDIAGDPDRRAGRWRERDQRLVVPVVDVEEVAELALAQGGLDREVALIAGSLAQVPECEGDGSPVGGAELADGDLTRHR